MGENGRNVGRLDNREGKTEEKHRKIWRWEGCRLHLFFEREDAGSIFTRHSIQIPKYMKDSEDLTRRLIEEAKQFVSQELKRVKSVNLNLLKNNVSEYMTKIIMEETDRKPMIVPVFMQVE